MLKDLLESGLRLVVCGTAASTVSAARDAYYAGPGNKFWRVLYEIGLTDRQLEPAEYQQLVGFGIGLTDVVKGQSGNDDKIDFGRSDLKGVRNKMLEFSPAILAFNGKKAAQVFFGRRAIDYGLQADTVGRTRLFVAPSTSGAANGSWDVGIWQELATLVDELDG